jgi:hypothetical protein
MLRIARLLVLWQSELEAREAYVGGRAVRRTLPAAAGAVGTAGSAVPAATGAIGAIGPRPVTLLTLLREKVNRFMTKTHAGNDPSPVNWILDTRAYGFKIRITTDIPSKIT